MFRPLLVKGHGSHRIIYINTQRKKTRSTPSFACHAHQYEYENICLRKHTFNALKLFNLGRSSSMFEQHLKLLDLHLNIYMKGQECERFLC